MINMRVKSLIAKILFKFGYGVKKLKRNFDVILNEVFDLVYEHNEELVIFDVGANDGGSIERFRKFIKNPIHIYSFEPSKQLFDELHKKYSENNDVTLVNIGVGDVTSEIVFNDHIIAHSSSTFNKMISDTKFAEKRNLNVDKYKVPIDSLDNYCRKNRLNKINLLKIDVEGFEEFVIKGAEKLLSKNLIDVIEIEVLITQVYDKRTSIYDIEKGLIDYGYRLIALSNDGRFYNMAAFDVLLNRELFLDLIYVNSKIFHKIRKLMM